MNILGIDLGTSSIKVTVLNAATKTVVASATYPEIETEISSPKEGWAEQDPNIWWKNTQEALQLVFKTVNPATIASIGIAYQMHGLVMVDNDQKVLRPSIIWCDSRASAYGEKAFKDLGEENAMSTLLNSPGNFTAAKLAWVKENEPKIYAKCHKIMLPGDYLAMMLSNSITTSASALSEGIFWDFKNECISKEIMQTFGFADSLLPEIKPVFGVHGLTTTEIEKTLGIKTGTPISYKAGDQPNNALSLNVLKPGEVAATAGTSGVIYAVSDQVNYDKKSRINSFAHVNYLPNTSPKIGILMCINGTGILNRWTKDLLGNSLSYVEMNQEAAKTEIGAEGLSILPFGNGAERIFENKEIKAHINGLNFNIHKQGHLIRAEQEGIAFALNYGLDIMKNNGLKVDIIKAGKANMFLSEVFTEAFVNVSNTPIELYDTDGSKGAALGGGFGAKIFASLPEALNGLKKIEEIKPKKELVEAYTKSYTTWKNILNKQLN